ncbi:family 78 glycoside hydrolase catalytic domain [Ginsengibacter hankyongi]|uniref:family 78 glycoside hydrolase catalytic domain n=1 Tax=Ginsengibacter hankyongi TaxID=2607284 RepID=UPI001F184EED|nr:family 78 glycoside hydrolase catalytic domain [Ginsengibacter hankyongi]
MERLLCDYQENPIGIDNKRPSLSWQLQSSQRFVQQTAYRILIADDSSLLQKNEGNIWDTKKLLSRQSLYIRFAGQKLLPVKNYYWKVMVWDNRGNVSSWSHMAKWQMGLLSTGDWKDAKWIGYNKLPDSLRLVPAIDNAGDKRWTEGADTLPLLRKEFTINKQIKKATVFITGLGQFEMCLNGKKVGDHFLDPGWTKFDQQVLYVTFDVTSKLRQGVNAIGVMLGNGFYYMPGERYHKLKGAYGYPKIICRLIIAFADGSEQNIISDQSWKACPGPVTFSSIYGGEDYNATLEQKGWNEPGFNDNSWRQAIIVNSPENLEAQSAYPLKIMDEFRVQKITEPKPGTWVYDMGQNASAIPLIKVEGKRGDVVKIIPAELLDDSGLVMQTPVGTPVYFKYTLKGDGVETWHPQFMYYGFRYIQLEGGVPENKTNKNEVPVIRELTSLHTRNSAPTIGRFTCSNELFNRIFKLIGWAIKSNTASIFTDCPHREKLGWLEEAHLVGSSIRYNYDIATLCRKVVRDMMHSQTVDGLIPDIAPEYVTFAGGFRDSPEWGSSGIILPYYLYQWYGDKQILEESYSMMKRYAAYLEKKSKSHLLYFGLGDWYDIGPNNLGPSQLTPEGMTSTAYYYYDLTILSKVAVLLHKNEDAKFYEALSEQVKKAYNDTFFNKQTKQYGAGSQTANAISLYMGLANVADKKKIIDNIIEDIRKHNNGVTSGDIGFRYLLQVLDEAGRSDVIFDMNSRADVPGYGYQLAQGATSLTESWQGNRISSNNHFMLGHLMEWFYSGLGGIKQAKNTKAFSHIIIRPEVVGDITFSKVSFLSPFGMITNNWEKKKGLFTMNTKIPVNTTAIIYLPATIGKSITENGKPILNRNDIKFLGFEEGKALLKVGSGSYLFIVK